MDFGFDEAAGGLAVVHGVFLKFAFAGLVADRAVEGMVDEQGFEHGFAHLLGGRRARVNLHAGRDGRCAGDGAARSGGFVGEDLAGDFRCPIFVENRLAVGSEHRQAEFDQTHAAIAGHGQLGMVAVVRHLDAGEGAGLEHGGGLQFALPVRHQLRHLDLAPVDLEFDFFGGWLEGFGFGCCRGGHRIFVLTHS